MIKRIIILGPTASGKTELSIKLAREIGGEIISVDSRQCYKHIDIGTAKPDPELINSVNHFNLSILDLKQNDSVADFLERAGEWSSEIMERNNYVIYAGGSTLHLQGLIYPFDELPASDPENIRILNRRIEQEGLEALYNELNNVDPEYAGKMDGMNRQRIIRALDIWRQTGKPFSSFHSHNESGPPEDTSVYGLHWPRSLLHERINLRVDAMIEEGLIEETRHLLDQGYSPDLQSLQSVGYREVITMLRGEITRKQMIKDIKTQTRRYAKRQITWFRRWDFIKWFERDNQSFEEIIETIKQDIT